MSGKNKYHKILLRDLRTVKDGKVISYNIGTAAHAPAMLSVLQKYLPEAKVTVWADAPLAQGLARMMRKRFPDVTIVHGSLNGEGKASTQELADMIRWGDLFLVGSGSGIAGSVLKDLRNFLKTTGKPYAAFAIGYNADLLPDYNKSVFIKFRDGTALKQAKQKRISCCTGYAPDAVFMFDCADEKAGDAFLKKNDLKAGDFICCVPGFRSTPRWEFFNTPCDPVKKAVNEEMEEHDHEPLRNTICEVVLKTGMKVLICAEQIPEMDLARRAIFYKLPENVRRKCVLLEDFWMPDLALSVYKRSCCVFGIEMHSQVMALGNGIPAVICRHNGFGSKSDMWKDVGVGGWLLEVDSPEYRDKVAATVLEIITNFVRAKEQTEAAHQRIDRFFREAISDSFVK